MARSNDLAALLKAFDTIPKAVRKAVKPAVAKGADEMAARMRYLAPDDDGALQGSIETEELNDLAVRVSAGGQATTVDSPSGPFDYALAQEFGTVDMERNSFFWPSVNSSKKRVRRRIDRAISKAVKDNFK